MSIKCPSSYLLSGFSLKIILLDIRIGIPSHFLGPFNWKNLFSNLNFEVVSVFEVEVFFLCTEEGWILFLYPFF